MYAMIAMTASGTRTSWPNARMVLQGLVSKSGIGLG